MNTAEFIRYLASLDIQLAADGDTLRLNAPKGVLTPALQAEIVSRKPELLAFMREAQVGAPAAEGALQPAPRGARLPLSLSQQGLWLEHQLDPATAAYNITSALRLRGTLDQNALERALTEIVRRHESLRTTFGSDNGSPFQHISPAGTFTLAVEDLTAAPSQVHHALRAHAQRPFDLEQGPLCRVYLFVLGADEYVLLIVMHHIISDGWSMGVFMREFQTLYRAYANGQPSPLPELTLQYADYAAWQRKALAGPALELQIAYWKQTLGGSLPILELPTDHPRPQVHSDRGALCVEVFPPALMTALLELGRQEQATLFMTLLAAFQTLLYRYTGQTDILVGTPVANRRRVEVEGLIGYLLNTLVLRTDLAGEPTFRELLRRTREVALGAFEHQDVPLEHLVQILQPERDPGHTPLFQVMLILQNAPMPPSQLAGLTAEPVLIDTETAKFDLTLGALETPEGLKVAFEYNTDLFEAPTIERMFGHLRTLLEAIVADPDQKVSELALLTARERQTLLVDWNATQAAYPQSASIPDLFREQAQCTPDAVALLYHNTNGTAESISYQELDGRSDQLAHYLNHLGVQRGTLVGLALDRSIEMVVGLLGILKAGGAYVPLDPAYPRERLAFMLQDTQLPILLTRRELAANLPAHRAVTVRLDADWAAINRVEGEWVPPAISPDDIAYVLYTSGSTGQPKGVMGVHRGAVNRFHWMWQAFPFARGEICCQKTSLNFVDSVWEIFGPLLQGVPTVILTDRVVKDATQLLDALARHRVTRLVLVPSLLRVLLEAEHNLASKLPDLRHWISSGEALTPDLAQRFLEQLPNAVLLNLYGSSEVAGDSTYYLLDRARPLPYVSLGRPIANTQTYVLDAHLQPVPIGVPGELCIGGAGLARGYWDRPALTAEKFVEVDGSRLDVAEWHVRLYRTGDRVRYHADGLLEFLGRLDDQVKLRGFRIELGEVTQVLQTHPAVREAVVSVRDWSAQDATLVAYVVASDAATPTVLREFCRERLPDYMLPGAFVLLDAIPRLPNGKVDRRALPALERQTVTDTAYRTPTSPMEQTVANAWLAVLPVEQVSVFDNFFDLGGTSLQSAQALARIEQALGVKLSVATMRVQTLGQLAVEYETLVASRQEQAPEPNRWVRALRRVTSPTKL